MKNAHDTCQKSKVRTHLDPMETHKMQKMLIQPDVFLHHFRVPGHRFQRGQRGSRAGFARIQRGIPAHPAREARRVRFPRGKRVETLCANAYRTPIPRGIRTAARFQRGKRVPYTNPARDSHCGAFPAREAGAGAFPAREAGRTAVRQSPKYPVAYSGSIASAPRFPRGIAFGGCESRAAYSGSSAGNGVKKWAAVFP